MTILLAVIIGCLFGFVLQRIDAADSDEVIKMLRLKKKKVISSLIFGVVFGSAILFVFLSSSQILVSLLSNEAVHWGISIAGLLLCIGWAISGFRPDTVLSALTTESKDSVYFVVGALVGAAILTVLYEQLLSNWLMTEIFGKTVIVVDNAANEALVDGSGILVAMFITILFMFGTLYTPQKAQ